MQKHTKISSYYQTPPNSYIKSKLILACNFSEIGSLNKHMNFRFQELLKITYN